MKYRKGFVTNSSSSSYVCDVCGREEISYDGLYDINMLECPYGHIICEEHKVKRKESYEEYVKRVRDSIEKMAFELSNNVEEMKELLERLNNKSDEKLLKFYEANFLNEDEDGDEHDTEISEEECPICTFETFIEDTYLKFIQKDYHEIYKKVKGEYKMHLHAVSLMALIHGKSIEDLQNEIKSKYKSWSELVK